MATKGVGARASVLAAGLFLLVFVLIAAAPGCLAGDEATGDSPAPPAEKPPESGKVEITADAGSVTGALQGQEGVRIQTMCTHCNSANIQVGGLSQDLVPISFGEYPLYGGLATSFVMNMLPSDSVSEAQIVRGPGEAAAPAAAAGGEIDLRTATPKELPWGDLFLDRGSFNLRSGSLRAAGPITPWLSGVVTGGATKVDPVRGPGEGTTWNSVAAVDRRLADARVYLTPWKAHRFEVGYSYIKEDDTEGRGKFDFWTTTVDHFSWVREDAHFTRKEYRLGWEWRLPNAGVLSLRGLQADRDQRVVSQDAGIAVPPLISDELGDRYRIAERDQWASIQYDQPIGFEWRVAAGFQSSTERVTAAALTPSTHEHYQDSLDKLQMQSGFVEAGYTPSTHWDFVAGLRRDDVRLTGQTTTLVPFPTTTNAELSRTPYSPRVMIKYRPGDAWTLRLVAGKTVRGPKPIFSEVCCGRSYISNAEAQVRPETAKTFALEGLYQPSPTLKASVYVARTDFTDFIQQLVSYSVLFEQIYANTNIPKARAETAEAALRWSPLGFLRLDGSIGWLSFLNTGERTVPIVYVPNSSRTPTLGVVVVDRIPYRPVRSGSVGASVTLPHEIVFGVQSTYTGPQLIQQWDIRGASPDNSFNGLLDAMRPIGGFWLTNLSLIVPVTRNIELAAGINNFDNFVQWDLGDPTRDYNWGPLTGRSYRLGLRIRLPR